jgi:hypothetical protein
MRDPDLSATPFLAVGSPGITSRLSEQPHESHQALPRRVLGRRGPLRPFDPARSLHPLRGRFFALAAACLLWLRRVSEAGLH